MKVWFITMTFPAPSETFACNDVLALRRVGVDIAVHGLRRSHPDGSRLIAERNLTDIWITHGSTQSILRGLWIGLTRPGLLFASIPWILRHTWNQPSHLLKSLVLLPRSLHLFTLVEREKPDILHVYWGHYPTLVAHLVQVRLPEIVVSISLSSYDLTTQYGCSQPVATTADVVSTWARVNIPVLESLGVRRDKILVAYQGLQLKKIASSNQQKIKRRIVTAGRLVEDKGMDDALRVFSQVLAKWSDASLVILGDGPARVQLERLAHELGIDHAVDFRGHVPYEAVFNEMAAAEVFLFMSKYVAERLPNVVKEAMACRCLCIATQTPGIEELLSDGQHGYVVQQGDVQTAAQKINQAFANSAAAQQMIEAAYTHLANHFDIDLLTKNLCDRWQHLLAGKLPSKARLAQQ